MKGACLILAVICSMLSPGTGYAWPSSTPQDQSFESPAKPNNAAHAASADDARGRMDIGPSDERYPRHDSDKSLMRGRRSAAKANRLGQLWNQQHFASGNGSNPHQFAPERIGSAVKPGLIPEESNQSLRVRSPDVIRHTAVSPAGVRHRGQNPATISGSRNSATRNAGEIDGRRVNRRP